MPYIFFLRKNYMPYNDINNKGGNYMSNQELKQTVMSTILLGLTYVELIMWSNEIAYEKRDLEYYDPDEYKEFVYMRKVLISLYKVVKASDMSTKSLKEVIHMHISIGFYDQEIVEMINGLDPEVQKILEQRVQSDIRD